MNKQDLLSVSDAKQDFVHLSTVLESLNCHALLFSSRFTRLSSGRSDYRVTFKDNWKAGRHPVSKQPSRHVPSQAPSLRQLVPLSHSQVCSHNLITVYNRHGPAAHFNADLYYLFQQNNPKTWNLPPDRLKINQTQTLCFSSFVDHIPF